MNELQYLDIKRLFCIYNIILSVNIVLTIIFSYENKLDYN